MCNIPQRSGGKIQSKRAGDKIIKFSRIPLIMIWRTIERPGYLGKKRNELHSLWNEQFGEANGD